MSASRFASSLRPLGGLLAAALLAGFASDARAQSATGPVPPAAPVLLAQADGGAAPEAAEAGERGAFTELNEALAAARARLEELTSAAEIASLAADLRRQLEAAQAENERLVSELVATGAALEEAEERARAARAEVEDRERALAELAAKNESLIAAAERSAAEIARLRQDLEALAQELASARSARAEAEARLDEMRQTLAAADAEAERLRGELEAAETALAARDETLSAAAAARDEVERLRARLAGAEAEIERLAAAGAAKDEEIAKLRRAADSAAAAARDNLVAVENKIKLLNAALADVQPFGPPAPAAGAAETPQREVADGATTTPGAAGGTIEQAALDDGSAARADDARGTGAVRPADDPGERGRSLAELTAALPVEERLQVQSLLADLGAETTEQGLLVTVPGGELFALNSEEIEASAHDTLAKVAEVMSIYDGRDVLITGHTDAMGEAAYNKALSERRADLVKQFFVDNFGIAPARLRTRGQGEEVPIASNATLEGRQANRRVEVLILD